MEKQKPITQQSRQGGQIVSLQKGKLPPQAIDLEEAVLGAMRHRQVKHHGVLLDERHRSAVLPRGSLAL